MAANAFPMSGVMTEDDGIEDADRSDKILIRNRKPDSRNRNPLFKYLMPFLNAARLKKNIYYMKL